MDSELARTFLTVLSAGNFVKAAERLFVTQSTVSTRIKTLEQQLGCKLFIRNKGGTTLTASGQQFQKHAVNLLRAVEQARHSVGVAKGFRASLTVAGRFSAWEELLLLWLPAMRAAAPDVAISSEIGFEDDLMLGLVEGRIDIGVMYTPQARPGLVVEALLEEEFVLVRSPDQKDGKPMSADYVYMDWGSEFRIRHSSSFPDFTGSALAANVGWLGLKYILRHGGSGYFSRRLVRQYLNSGQLNLVNDTPVFRLPAYLVYPSDHDTSVFEIALDQIRLIATEVEST